MTQLAPKVTSKRAQLGVGIAQGAIPCSPAARAAAIQVVATIGDRCVRCDTICRAIVGYNRVSQGCSCSFTEYPAAIKVCTVP